MSRWDTGNSPNGTRAVWIGRQPQVIEPAQPVHCDATAAGAFCRLFLYEKSGILSFRFSDGIEFCVNIKATQTWTTWLAPSSVEDMDTYLLGPILRIRGSVTLLANSFVDGKHAIALLGHADAGK